MQIKEIQMVYTSADYYTGKPDGDFGPKSFAAMVAIEEKYSLNTSNLKRRQIASVQACLNVLGFEAGTVDGYEGHNTREAFAAWAAHFDYKKFEAASREPVGYQPIVTTDVPRQKDLGKYYGNPETEIPSRLTQIRLPFKFRIDYNLEQSTSKITLHELAAPSLEQALIAVYNHYGEERWRELGLDRYAGAYNKRFMCGGNAWSTHAYGCAIDFYAAPNGLRIKSPNALFCGPDYKAFLDIMESHGWLPAIRLWGADAMHFQRATL